MKLLRFLLFPIAVIYDIVTTIRNLFFDIGFFKQKEFELPVIAVGNLSVGGTGKSPQIEYLIRLLKGKYKVATLSRGYKRKTEGFQLLNRTHTTEDVGDEPMQFYRKFADIAVAVDANRVNGINELIKRETPEVVLLDDAFQHRKVKASFYVLLTKFDDLFSDDFILPTGNLRESRRGARRADIIVVTKCPGSLTTEEQKSIQQRLKVSRKQQVFFSRIKYEETIYSQQGSMRIDDLSNSKIVLVTGIAAPKPLLHFLTGKGISYQHINFPDHHNFAQKDLNKIKEAANELSGERRIILTTEKDYVRLGNSIDNLYYLPIESSFLCNDKEFNELILNHVEARKN